MLGLLSKPENFYSVECHSHWYTLFGRRIFPRLKPKLKWREKITNIVVTTGLNKYLDATLKTGFQVNDPTVTPTVNVTGGGASGGSLQPGAYYLKYTFVNANGQSNVSPESAQFTVASGNIPQVTLPVLPAGATSISIFITAAGGASGTETRYATGVTGTTYNLATAQSAGAAMPSSNTAFSTPSWFVGLKGTGTVVAGDTLQSHAGWAEIAPYSNATRPQWTPGTISAGSVDNSAAKAVFNINATATVYGCFLTNDAVVSGTFGLLFGAGDFSSSRSVASGDTLNVTVTCTEA
jgi:hypothetical protein